MVGVLDGKTLLRGQRAARAGLTSHSPDSPRVGLLGRSSGGLVAVRHIESVNWMAEGLLFAVGNGH